MQFVRRRYFKRVLGPVSRLELTPATVGRTLAVGLAWGISATVGLQVIGVTACWLVARWLRHPFHYPIALLLTGLSNPLTLAPMYSFYFFIGATVLWAEEAEAAPVARLVDRLSDGELWQVLMDSGWFLAICFVGSLPFAVAGAAAGYYFGHHVGYRLSKRRLARRRRRAAIVEARTAKSS